MRVLIATDAFPPVCGGSGWSTYELARGLRARGHEIHVVRPRFRSTMTGAGEEYDGFKPTIFSAWAPRVPFVRNYFRNERLYRTFAPFLVEYIQRHRIDLIHAQHVLTGPSSINAARIAQVPAVCTVRDYWPVCYWSDLILDPQAAALCPACTAGRMTQCIRPHGGRAWPLALPVIPYMRANLSVKRRSLAAADAVIAVSSAIQADLRRLAPELAGTRVEMIHNPVDVQDIRAQAEAVVRPMTEPYAVFVGKLEPNKGVRKLLTVIEHTRLDWPLVVVGDGSERAALELEASRLGREVRVLGWRPRADALAWLRHAEMLVFPSHGPESLSRVLLEASALGVPIAAMETGGTADIVVHGETGLLSQSAETLADDVATLRRDSVLRAQLGEAARRRVDAHFAVSLVVDQVERLYKELTDPAKRWQPA